MYYSEIKNCDIANGEGVRVSLFVSGCRIKCKGCFNPGTWNFKNGKEFTEEVENKILDMLGEYYIDGLSILGGEPFEEENQKAISNFLFKVREKYPHKNIWCYSGYTIENILNGKQYFGNVTDLLLSCIDVLVDSPFVEAEKDVSLKFRGSRNQRLWNTRTMQPYELKEVNMKQGEYRQKILR